MKLSQHTPRFLIAALLSLGVASGAFAMPGGDAAHAGFPMHGAPHAHFGHGGKAMQRLHEELKLDSKQEAAWQDAEKFAKDTFAGAHENARKQRQDINTALGQTGADLRAILKRMDELKAEGQKQHSAVRERWLAVYDTLNAEQKEKVRMFFKSGAERMGRAMDRRGQEQDPHHGRHHGDPRQAPGAEANAPRRQ